MVKELYSVEHRQVISNRLRMHRSDLRLSQEAFAAMCRLDLKKYKEIERGLSATQHIYQKVVDGLGIAGRPLSYDELVEPNPIDIVGSYWVKVADKVDELKDTQYFPGHAMWKFSQDFLELNHGHIFFSPNLNKVLEGTSLDALDLLVASKLDIDSDFTNFLKSLDIDLDRRCYLHAFSVIYLILKSNSFERRSMARDMIVSLAYQICEVIDEIDLNGQREPRRET